MSLAASLCGRTDLARQSAGEHKLATLAVMMNASVAGRAIRFIKIPLSWRDIVHDIMPNMVSYVKIITLVP